MRLEVRYINGRFYAPENQAPTQLIDSWPLHEEHLSRPSTVVHAVKWVMQTIRLRGLQDTMEDIDIVIAP